MKCVSLREKGWYRTIMFTHDPSFDPQGDQWETVKKYCDKWNIDTDDIVYEDPKKEGKKNGTYNGEKSSHYAFFFRKYSHLLKDCHILSDAGPSLKITKNGKSEYIFADGSDWYDILPAETHGETSILDHFVFADAKGWWRDGRENYPIYIQDLYLMFCIDSVRHERIRGMWKKNFLLDKKELKLKHVDRLLRGTQGKKAMRKLAQEKYISAYLDYKGSKGDNLSASEVHELDNALDGEYWR